MIVTMGATVLRLSPPGRDRLETAGAFDVSVTGAASNAAVTAARLGADACWLSKVPDSPLGRRIVGTVAANGVTTDVVRTDGRAGVRYVERGATPRAGTTVAADAGAAATTISPDDLPMERVRTADLVYVSAASMALSTDLLRSAATVLREANQAGVRTVVGGHYRETWSVEQARETLEGLFPAVDDLIAPEIALRRVFDRPDDTPSELAHAVGANYDLDAVAIAREHGGLLWENATLHEAAAPETDAVDPGGAVDAFAGAYLAGERAGTAPETVLEEAVAAATLARTHATDLPAITPEEVAAVRERMAAMD